MGMVDIFNVTSTRPDSLDLFLMTYCIWKRRSWTVAGMEMMTQSETAQRVSCEELLLPLQARWDHYRVR